MVAKAGSAHPDRLRQRWNIHSEDGAEIGWVETIIVVDTAVGSIEEKARHEVSHVANADVHGFSAVGRPTFADHGETYAPWRLATFT